MTDFEIDLNTPKPTVVRNEVSLRTRLELSGGQVIDNTVPFDPEHPPQLRSSRAIVGCPATEGRLDALVAGRPVLIVHGFCPPHDSEATFEVREEQTVYGDRMGGKGYKPRRIVIEYEDAEGNAQEDVIPVGDANLTKYFAPVKDPVNGETRMQDEYQFVLEGRTWEGIYRKP